MVPRATLAVATALAWLFSTTPTAAGPAATNYVRGDFHELNESGAWSWFMDERVIVDRDRLIVGSVRANGTFQDRMNPGWGNVELTVFDLTSGERRVVVLYEQFEQDDHDCPGLLVLSDGRYLAAYSKHNQEPRVYFRISTRPHDPFAWQPATELVTPGVKGTWSGDNFTYCNPFRLADEKGRIYLFHSGVSQDRTTWRGSVARPGRDGSSVSLRQVGRPALGRARNRPRGQTAVRRRG